MSKYISKSIATLITWTSANFISNSLVPTLTIDTSLLQMENVDMAINVAKFDGTLRGIVTLAAIGITYLIWRKVIKSAVNK